MELRQLEYFIAIIDSGAFSRAAMKLGVGQPMLSRQIRALEQEFGVELYHRTGRGIAVTEAGKILEDHARTMLATASAARRDVGALGLSPAGSVVIGMPPSVGKTLAAPIVKRFSAEFPNVRLGVIEGFSAHVLEWLLTGRMDIAVLYDSPRIQSLLTDPLLQDELFLLGPPGDPAGVGDGPVPAARLREIPLILPSRPDGLRLLLDDVTRHLGIAPDIRIEMDAMNSTLRLVAQGVAYTVLSYSCAHDLVSTGQIRCWRLVEPTITRSLVVASSTQRPSTRPARALAGLVREEAQAMVDQGLWSPHAQGPAGTRPPG